MLVKLLLYVLLRADLLPPWLRLRLWLWLGLWLRLELLRSLWADVLWHARRPAGPGARAAAARRAGYAAGYAAGHAAESNSRYARGHAADPAAGSATPDGNAARGPRVAWHSRRSGPAAAAREVLGSSVAHG